MRLPDQIRAVACVSWVTVLGAGTYFAQEAVSSSRAGVIRDRRAGTTAAVGAQDAPSRPRTGEPHTGESAGANPRSPGHASESPTPYRGIRFGADNLRRDSFAPNDSIQVARSQGVRSVPRPVQPVSLLKEAGRGSYQPYILTAYSAGCILPKFGPEPPPQPMASGEWPVAGLHVAADPSLAFGTVLEVVYRGLPSRLIVGDRGRWIRGRRLDLFLADCRAARAWGRRTAYVRTVSE